MGIKDWWSSVRGASSPESSESVLPSAPTVAELLQQLDGIEADINAKAVSGAISPIIAGRVTSIAAVTRDVIPRLDRLGGSGTRDGHSVMATVTSYLPEALEAYLRLPRQFADTRPVAGTKTSLMVLVDQLDLLNRTMDKILDAATRRDVDALIAHGRFLTDKFGTSADGGDLNLGSVG